MGRFTEHFNVYTIEDEKTHTYFTSFTLDSDKNDIVTTVKLKFPYHNDLMEYWEPIRTGIIIQGGVFDYETLFIGRVREVRQTGYEIEIMCQNVGWKFKQQIPSEFYETNMVSQPCVTAVEEIFKFLKIDYEINLEGIPDYESYNFNEDGTIEFSGNTIDKVPDLATVVSNIENYDVSKRAARYKQTLSIEESYKKSSEEMKKLSVMDILNNKDTQNFMTKSTIEGKIDVGELLTSDVPAYEDKSFEEVIKNICSAMDAHWYIIDNKVYFLSYFVLFCKDKDITGAKVETPLIDYWMIKDGSYDLTVDQYGFYNTVEVKYSDGSVTEAYEDLVRVYGEMKVVYKEKDLDKTTATLKAQAYLSAHVRDFGMSIKLKCLYSGKLITSTFCKTRNPLTLNEDLYFINGLTASWTADDNTFLADVELVYGPYNPDNPEIPETGNDGQEIAIDGSGTGTEIVGPPHVQQAVQEVVNMFAGKTYQHRSTANDIRNGSGGDCYAATYFIWEELQKRGVPCRIMWKWGRGKYSGTHRVCMYSTGSAWVYFPMNLLPDGLGMGVMPPVGECIVRDENGVQHCSSPTGTRPANLSYNTERG